MQNFKQDQQSTCHVKNALEILQGKWTLQIIYLLLTKKTMRFGQLKRALPGINNTILATTLKKLEEKKIVLRVQYNELPLRVEYSLTAMGKNLDDVFQELDSWWENSMQ